MLTYADVCRRMRRRLATIRTYETHALREEVQYGSLESRIERRMRHVRFMSIARLHTSAYVSMRQRLHLEHRMRHVHLNSKYLVAL